MATFIITTRTNGEFQFNLHAENDEIILTSEGYTTKSSCKNGIQSVQHHASEDELYEQNTSADNQFYFNLKASNGQVIGTSEMYETQEACDQGVQAVKQQAVEASTDDQSYNETVVEDDQMDLDADGVNLAPEDGSMSDKEA
jgi:uncharacterized protein